MFLLKLSKLDYCYTFFSFYFHGVLLLCHLCCYFDGNILGTFTWYPNKFLFMMKRISVANHHPRKFNTITK